MLFRSLRDGEKRQERKNKTTTKNALTSQRRNKGLSQRNIFHLHSREKIKQANNKLGQRARNAGRDACVASSWRGGRARACGPMAAPWRAEVVSEDAAWIRLSADAAWEG